jgi:metal-responsive CopG/Arc/MetJ family transcriptional regulator
MFGGGNKIKIDKDLLDRVKQIAEVAGYASHEEFVMHIIEREIAQFEDAGSDDDITEKLKGLGYIS